HFSMGYCIRTVPHRLVISVTGRRRSNQRWVFLRALAANQTVPSSIFLNNFCKNGLTEPELAVNLCPRIGLFSVPAPPLRVGERRGFLTSEFRWRDFGRLRRNCSVDATPFFSRNSSQRVGWTA